MIDKKIDGLASDDINRVLARFTALGTEFGAGYILRAAFRTKRWCRFLFGRVAASGTEAGIGCHVFSAVAALAEHQLLMTAHGAEFCR